MPENTEDPETSERPPCMPCRGTGTVVSNLGGEPSTVPCPWCGGTGRKPAGEVDAQALAPRVEPPEETSAQAGETSAQAGETRTQADEASVRAGEQAGAP